MGVNVFDYVDKLEYESICKNLKVDELVTLYSNEVLDIEVMKIGKRVYTIVNSYGDKTLNEVLNKVCSLV